MWAQKRESERSEGNAKTDARKRREVRSKGGLGKVGGEEGQNILEP